MATWSNEIVASTGDVGQQASLADVAGRPVIAYHDRDNAALRCARWTGATWADDLISADWYAVGLNSRRVAAFALHGQPAIAFMHPSGKVRLAEFNGSSWSTSDVISMTAVAVAAVEHDGDAAVAVQSQSTTTSVVRRVSGNWIATQIEAVGGAGTPGVSIAVVGGKLCLAYRDGSALDLRFARLDGTWSTQTVYSLDDTGRSPSLTDYGGNPFIAFGHIPSVGSASIAAAIFNGSSWVITTVAAVTSTIPEFGPSALVVAFVPRVAFYDGQFASWNGSSWDIETFDDDGDRWVSGVNLDGDAAVAAYDQIADDLRYSLATFTERRLPATFSQSTSGDSVPPACRVPGAVSISRTMPARPSVEDIEAEASRVGHVQRSRRSVTVMPPLSAVGHSAALFAGRRGIVVPGDSVPPACRAPGAVSISRTMPARPSVEDIEAEASRVGHVQRSRRSVTVMPPLGPASLSTELFAGRRSTLVVGDSVPPAHRAPMAGSRTVLPLAAVRVPLHQPWTRVYVVPGVSIPPSAIAPMAGSITRQKPTRPFAGYEVMVAAAKAGSGERFDVPAPTAQTVITGTADSRQWASVKARQRHGIVDIEPHRPVLVAFDGDGNLLDPVPNAPRGIVLTQAAGVVTVSWQYSSSGEMVAVGTFAIYQAVDGDVVYDTPVATVTASGRRAYSRSLGTFDNGAVVKVAVRARDADGNEEQNTVVATLTVATTQPGAPASIAVTVL
jgi:hypothetical protein